MKTELKPFAQLIITRHKAGGHMSDIGSDLVSRPYRVPVIRFLCNDQQPVWYPTNGLLIVAQETYHRYPVGAGHEVRTDI